MTGRQFSVKLDGDLTALVDAWLARNPDIKQSTMAVMAIRKFVTEKQELHSIEELPAKKEDDEKAVPAKSVDRIAIETDSRKLSAWYFRSGALLDVKKAIVQNQHASEELLVHAIFESGDELLACAALDHPAISTALLRRVACASPARRLAMACAGTPSTY